MLNSLLFFILAVAGLTGIIVDSSISKWFKDNMAEYTPTLIKGSWWAKKIAEGLNCYQCTGTWAGFFLGYVLLSHNIWCVLASGFAGSFIASLGAMLLNYLEAQTLINLDEGEVKNS